MTTKIRAMKVAVRRMMYAVSLLGAVACGGEHSEPGQAVEALVEPNALPVAFCESAFSCAPDSPLGMLAAKSLVTSETTLDGCLEIGEELRDALEPEQAAEWADLLTTDPCEL